jgi:hypothetical protein
MVLKHNESQNNTGQMAMVNCNEKLINQSTNSTPFPSYSSSTSPFIYVTGDRTENKSPKNPVNSGVKEKYDIEIAEENHTGFPLFFQNNINTILIPKKVKTYLERVLPKEYLKNIDSDTDIAVEMCLVQVSNLSSTIYSENRWKELSSTRMDEQTKKGKDNTRIYPKIMNALKYSTDTTEGVIQVKKNEFGKETYQEGIACKSYSFTDTYYKGDLVEYIIKDKGILQKRNKFFYSQLKKATDNAIANNLISLYSKIELPSYDDMLSEAKKLIIEKHKNKKGRTLTFLNKHPKSYYKDSSARSFFEENIKLYNYLTQRGFMIPIIGKEKSGGRVVDSFTLMPSWIRKLVKIDGKSIVEVDYKALHPNIAMSLYGGSKKYLTHKLVAEESTVNLSEVKIEHLSFFNKTGRDMKASKLYNYYQTSEPLMLKKIEEDKWNSAKKHKITSMKMFAKEVEIMTECIKQLNSKGIYVGYIYDALFCKGSDAKIVEEIMNKVVLEFKVYTTASIG